MTDTPRPKQHLITIARKYPGAWRQVDELRASRGKDLPDWPEWCYLPLAGWYAIVSAATGVDRIDLRDISAVGRLAALGTWRMTQSIYRFDPDLLAALVSTPVEGDLPAELFYRLPEWCVYIETPGQQWNAIPLYGFFAHMEWDVNTGRDELRLVLDAEDALHPIPIHIGQWPLAEAMQRAVVEAKRQAVYDGSTAMAASLPPTLDFQIEPLISVLLYLCSENVEIGPGTDYPHNPEPKRTKKGWRLFASDKTRTWDVGVRTGAALRQGRTAAHDGDGTHASPRPHWRRAHWHIYRIGPGRTERQLKWLPPIPVNIDNVESIPITVKRKE